VVRDVEQILVGRKRQAVQLFEIIGDNLHIAGGRTEAIDVASADSLSALTPSSSERIP
jgi:hypothetical protein